MNAVAYPKRLELHNPITDARISLNLKEVSELKIEKLIDYAPGSHVLIHQQVDCYVTEAWAVLGLMIEILEPRAKDYLKKCKNLRVSLSVDGEKVLLNERVKDGIPIQEKKFLNQGMLFQAFIPEGDRIGIFLPSGCFVNVTISGLAKTKIFVKVRVTLNRALYTTRPDGY